jgi:hypothetical protein
VRVLANLEKFFRWARIGEDLLLVRLGLAGGMCFPQFLTGRVVIIGLVTKVGLVGVIILNV